MQRRPTCEAGLVVNVSGERDLQILLATMEPRLEEGEWVFVTVPRIPDEITPLATFAEPEGLSAVIRLEDAVRAGLDHDFVAAWISVGVHSALDAVGLTAALASQLTSANISCNVVAAHHHDHLFVPIDSAHEALSLLQSLARMATT